jgi:hypothetical protein
MRISSCLAGLLIFAVCPLSQAKKADHEWLVGRVLDENQSRHFAGMIHNSSSHSTEDGTWSGDANSTSVGDSTNTQMSGSYSGVRNTSNSGTSVAIYRVYDNLVVEGEDAVYVTSERLRWRWSKGAHVAVNGAIKYFVEGRKLHVLDDDNKEHSIEILKEIKKVSPPREPMSTERPNIPSAVSTQVSSTQLAQVPVVVDSTPSGADIEVDGNFVGNTPSTVSVAQGSHEISVKKKGFETWNRKMSVTGGSVHLSAELEPMPGN